jgi:hypothetical protein
MARKSISERLAHLDAQKKTLQARLNHQERARDTRRKVLLGALLLYRIEEGDDAMAKQLAAWIKAELPGFLTRDTDKLLFDDFLPGSTTGQADGAPE